MKKNLLSLALTAMLLPSISAYAEDALQEIWCSPDAEVFKGSWDGKTLNWDTPNSIKGTSNPRFATAWDGKVYTIDQMTMSIAEATQQGTLVPVYTLPKPADATEYYGTAITVDEAGNFLVGMDFVLRPKSSLNFAIYCPSTGEIKKFTLDTPAGWEIGRLDCLGRVLGDLTKEAYFTIAPESTYKVGEVYYTPTPQVRIIKVTGNGTLESVTMEDITDFEVEAYTQQNIAQPAYHTLSAAKAAGVNGVKEFYYSSCNETNNYYAYYNGSTVNTDFAPSMPYTSIAGTNGFDTFVVDGKRYFVRNWADTKGARTMNVVVMDEDGNELAKWINADYVINGGYSTIITEPLADKTVNIYVYNSGTKHGAVAKLNFNPSLAGTPVVPEIPVGVKANPYKISTATDLTTMLSKISGNEFYAILEADIDLDNQPFTAIKSSVPIHLDGQNHTISNLNSSSQEASLFYDFTGSIKNLGIINFTGFSGNWGLSGPFAGYIVEEGLIENCYAIGGTADGYYAGGIIGGVQKGGKATIRNCYSCVNAEAVYLNGNVMHHNGYAGGLVGCCNETSTLIIENSYAAGNLKAASSAGGIVGGISGTGAISITIDNAAVFCETITGNASTTALYPSAANITISASNTYVCNDTKVNNVTYSGDNAKTKAGLVSLIQSWEGFKTDEVNNRTGLPMLSWEVQPEIPQGDIENPYRILTAEDLVNMVYKIGTTDFYAILEADIDMTGVTYAAVNKPSVNIYLDGQNHVIKNLVIANSDLWHVGLFGDFKGSIKNLGVENANITARTWGLASPLIGSANGPTTVENCYTTGSATGNYAGGILGCVQAGVTATINNCYSSADATANRPADGSGFAGGIAGPTLANASLTVKNAYSSGTITAMNYAGGISCGSTAGTACTITLDNVATYSPSISGATADAILVTNGTLTSNVTNKYVCEDTKVNNESASGAMSQAALTKTIQSWAGYNSNSVNAETKLPILAWQNGLQYGAAEDFPLIISTPEDLVNLNSNLVPSGFTYAALANDIDMSGVAYPVLAQTAIANIHLDGKNHVIKNLSVNAGFAGLFAEMNGSVKNLGFENIDITTGLWGGAGAIAGYIANSSPTTIENCYVTGKITGGASAQLGSFASGNRHEATISSCYSSAEISGGGGTQGGFIGVIMYTNDGSENALNINDSYFSGTIINGGQVGGFVGANKAYLHPATGTEVLNLNNAAVISASLNGATVAPFMNIDGKTATINKNEAYIGSNTSINGEEISVYHEDYMRTGDLIDDVVKKWTGYNRDYVNESGLPILEWQKGNLKDYVFDGIEDIVADDNAPAVYYNLQGVRVANPESGIYIVRRGNKVTKELVK